MKNLKKLFAGAIAVLGLAFVGAALPVTSAQAAVTCINYNHTNGGPDPTDAYPYDGHAHVCFTGFSVAKANTMFPQVQNLSGNTGTYNIGTSLKTAQTNFFYFATRDDANYWFAHNATWVSPAFQTTTARCGFTNATVPLTELAASSVYDTCSFSNGSLPANPDVAKTFSHELGHAADYALAYAHGVNVLGLVSTSSGFKSQVNADLNNMNNAGIVACGTGNVIFNTGLPSPLEVDLGTPNIAVCKSNGTLNSPYTGTNKHVMQQATPYFSNPAAAQQWNDMWAEEFSDVTGFNSSVLLPTIDHVIPENPQGMKCSTFVLDTLYIFGKLPVAAAQPYPLGCPSVADSTYGLNH